MFVLFWVAKETFYRWHFQFCMMMTQIERYVPGTGHVKTHVLSLALSFVFFVFVFEHPDNQVSPMKR